MARGQLEEFFCSQMIRDERAVTIGHVSIDKNRAVFHLAPAQEHATVGHVHLLTRCLLEAEELFRHFHHSRIDLSGGHGRVRVIMRVGALRAAAA